MTTVGIIGMGQIGTGVATGVTRAGLDLVVCDVDPSATAPFAERARVATDPADLAAHAEVVVVAVVDDDQARAVVTGPGGVLAAARPGTAVLVVSTLTVPTLRELAAAAADAGVDVMDCAVTGGPAAAAKGSMVSMVGGTPAAVARVQPVLDAFSSKVVHVGPVGAGIRAKLARNLVQYAAWLAAYEGQRLAEAAGVPLATLAELIRAGDATTGGLTALMFRDTVAPYGEGADEGLVRAMRQAAALAHKDLRAAIALGRDLGVELPLAEMAEVRCDAVFGVASDRRAAGTEVGRA